MALPYIDAHSVEVEAAPSAVWEALTGWLGRGGGLPANAQFVRLLGCDQVSANGNPGEQGSTVPGFRVAGAHPPLELALEGGHRFSDYQLDFQIEALVGGRSMLSATTHAAFPGLKGELYKSAVIRSRAHVVVTRRMLHAVARRAENATLNR